jgi:hypothetical protein
LLKVWDDATAALSVAALAIAFIPGLDALDLVLAPVVAGMSALSTVGHLYEAADGKEKLTKGKVVMDVISFLPAGRVLGKLAKVNPKAFENLPGIVKRFSSYTDARRVTGILSSKGIKVAGRVVYRVHVVPKVVSGSEPLVKTLLAVKGLQLSVKAYQSVTDLIDDAHKVDSSLFGDSHKADTPTQRGDDTPITTLQIQPTPPMAPMQGSSLQVQG